MNDYQPDLPQQPIDLMFIVEAGPEPRFGVETADFLHESYQQLKARLRPTSLVKVLSFGQHVPWLMRLDFSTVGLGRDSVSGEVARLNHHTFALRFLGDYLRNADRFQMLLLLSNRGSVQPFHPNIGAPLGDSRPVCLEIYPGESLTEIVLSIHDLIRWKLRNLRESDALNHDACIYGRNHVIKPLDDRPLFGQAIELELVEQREGD